MGIIPTGQSGLPVQPHVVSASELATGRVVTPSLSLEGSLVKTKAWVYRMKRSIVTCGIVEVRGNCLLQTVSLASCYGVID